MQKFFGGITLFGLVVVGFVGCGAGQIECATPQITPSDQLAGGRVLCGDWSPVAVACDFRYTDDGILDIFCLDQSKMVGKSCRTVGVCVPPPNKNGGSMVLWNGRAPSVAAFPGSANSDACCLSATADF